MILNRQNIALTILRISLILCSIFLLSHCSQWHHYHLRLKAKLPGQLRVASYNVNWGEENDHNKYPRRTLAAIKMTKADIILLQETTPTWERRIKKKLSGAYTYMIFYHDNEKQNGGGFAVLSHYPIHTTLYQHPHIGWHPVWIFTAKTSLGIIQFVNVHLSPPLANFDSIGFLGSAILTSQGVRRREIDFIYQHLNHQLPTILTGDFNEGDIGRAVKQLNALGFIDGFKAKKLYTHTWEYQLGPLNLHDRLDRVFYTPSLHLSQLQVLHRGDSDHYPLVADFTLIMEKKTP